MKTNKSYTKRIKSTKTGKLLARKSGHNHFNAKESTREKHAKRRMLGVTMTAKAIRLYLPGKNFKG